MTQQLIERALKEDIGAGDITTQATIPEKTIVTASIESKQNIILSGLNVAQEVFTALCNIESWKASKSDGDLCRAGEEIVKIRGEAAPLLTAERTALNFLQHLSGIATLTRLFISMVVGTGIQITDTRKTIPGLRSLEKMAVEHGGGMNHRKGLYDQYLIKDNHIDIAGGVKAAIQKVKKQQKEGTILECEVRDEKELAEALEVGVDIVMLDNWPVEKIDKAIAKASGRCRIELSGGITLENIKDYARPGVDYISIGALTHSARAVDISMIIYT